MTQDNVLRPADEIELASLVGAAVASGRSLELIGKGTKRDLGRPVHAEALVDLSRLTGIVDYSPEELVLTARPGTPMSEIEATVGAARQMLAFEPPDLGPLYGRVAGGGTLAGALACNLSGPRRLKAGAARDHFLGFRAVNGRGETFKAGGKVVKNVTGYDLCKLVAGSYGTLVALTELSIKVLPAPETTITLCAVGLAPDAAMAALGDALASPHEVSGAVYLPADLGADLGPSRGLSCAAVRIEGVAPSVAARAAALRAVWGGCGELVAIEGEAAGRFWMAVRDVAPFAHGNSPVWRISVPPATGALAHGRLRRALPEARLFHDWGGGLIWLGLPTGAEAMAVPLRAALAGLGGHATLVRAPIEARARVPVFEPQEPAIDALARRLKASFDPRAIFNRGRMYEGV